MKKTINKKNYRRTRLTIEQRANQLITEAKQLAVQRGFDFGGHMALANACQVSVATAFCYFKTRELLNDTLCILLLEEKAPEFNIAKIEAMVYLSRRLKEVPALTISKYVPDFESLTEVYNRDYLSTLEPLIESMANIAGAVACEDSSKAA